MNALRAWRIWQLVMAVVGGAIAYHYTGWLGVGWAAFYVLFTQLWEMHDTQLAILEVLNFGIGRRCPKCMAFTLKGEMCECELEIEKSLDDLVKKARRS